MRKSCIMVGMKMPLWKRNLIICWIGSFATGAGMSQFSPIFPIYIKELGIHDPGQIAELSGLAFGVTFLFAAVFSPVWGRAADRYGRKAMLLRAGLGMTVIIFFIGFAQNVIMLVVLRALQGTISGYITACNTLIATQTEKKHAGFALGVLSTAVVSGSLIGPLFAGFMVEYFATRTTFFITSGLMLFTFILTLVFVKEDFKPAESLKKMRFRDVWTKLPEKGATASIMAGFFVIAFTNFSIQPVMTLYVEEISRDVSHLALLSGLVFSVTGLSSVIFAPILGKLSDRVGTHKIAVCVFLLGGFILIPQAFVTSILQLCILRFIFGIASGGMQPMMTTALKKLAPDELTGTVFGYSYALHYVGVFSGTVLGGQIAARISINMIFLVCSALVLVCLVQYYFNVYRRIETIRKPTVE